jgi:hypothetical protein
MIERIEADARRRHATADHAVLLEHLDVAPGAAQNARAGKACNPGPNDSDLFRHVSSATSQTRDVAPFRMLTRADAIERRTLRPPLDQLMTLRRID